MSILSEFQLAQMYLSVLTYVECGGLQGFLGLLQPAETKEVPRKKELLSCHSPQDHSFLSLLDILHIAADQKKVIFDQKFGFLDQCDPFRVH